MKRCVVLHHQIPSVRYIAHVKLDTRYSVVAGGTYERSKRVLVPTGRPSTMGDKLHEEAPQRRVGRTMQSPHGDETSIRTAQGALSAVFEGFELRQPP